jgi:hypothetical protein
VDPAGLAGVPFGFGLFIVAVPAHAPVDQRLKRRGVSRYVTWTGVLGTTSRASISAALSSLSRWASIRSDSPGTDAWISENRRAPRATASRMAELHRRPISSTES